MKTIDETYQEIENRNRNERSSIYSSFRPEYMTDSRYESYRDMITRYPRWIQDDWTFPEHIQRYENYFIKNFGGCRWTTESPFAKDRLGVPTHLHRTNKGNSWAYTIGIPYDLNDTSTYEFKYYDYFEPIGIDPLSLSYDEIKSALVTQEPKTIHVKPFSRISFRSGRIPHGTGPLNGRRWVWLLYDLNCKKELHRDIDIVEFSADTDPSADIQSFLGMTDNFENVPFSEFYYFDDEEFRKSMTKLPEPKP
jgi:hypothetical protein